jgi:hypothetical protein
MGKYVITESQLKKVVYGILNPRVVGLYVEDVSRYPYYHYKVKEVDSHYIILNILGKKKFTITHKSYKVHHDGEHHNKIFFKESLVEFISKVVRIRKTKSMDIIADWVEDTYNLDVENIEFSDSSFTHGITKYLKKIK